MFLFTDGEQSDAWAMLAESDAGIDIAHDGELRAHARRAVDVGADVDYNDGRTLEGRKSRRERGTIDAWQHTLHHFRGRHDSGGIARRDDSVSDAIAYEAAGNADGAI